MNSLIDLYSLPLAYSGQGIKISQYTEFELIRYTWNRSDERVFYTKKGTAMDLSEVSNFPGLLEFYRGKIAERKYRNVRPKTSRKYITIDHTRGSQSFAFGHFFVDIIPLLAYMYTLNSLMLGGYHNLLIYSRERWQEDILDMVGIPHNSLKYLDDIKPNKMEKQVRDYRLDLALINCDIEKLRKSFAHYPLQYEKKKAGNGILFLKRDEVKHRPRRWLNIEECMVKCRLDQELLDRVEDLNPGAILPSELASKSSEYKVVVSAPGSGAYIPLHTITQNEFMILTTGFNVHSERLWDFTLSMFNHYKEKLILVSSIDANEPTSQGWDSGFSLEADDFSYFCKLVLEFSQKKEKEADYLYIAKATSLSNVRMTYNNLRVLIPGENELCKFLREYGFQSI